MTAVPLRRPTREKIAKYIAIGLLVLIGIIFLYSYTAYPSEYVNRVLR